jgi:prolipoprotein diacylglyceryltransferase
MIFLLVLSAWLWRLSKRPHRNGQLFATFMMAYLAFRLVEDFLKPTIHFGGLCAIQWACLAGLIYYVSGIPQRLNKEDSCLVESAPISSMTSR